MSDKRESYKRALNQIKESERFREETAKKMKEAWEKRQAAAPAQEAGQQEKRESFEISVEEITGAQGRRENSRRKSYFRAVSGIAAVFLCGVLLLSALRTIRIKEEAEEKGKRPAVTQQQDGEVLSAGTATPEPAKDPVREAAATGMPQPDKAPTLKPTGAPAQEKRVLLDTEQAGYYCLYDEIEEMAGLPADGAGAYIYGSARRARENGVEYEYLSMTDPNEEIGLYFRNSFDAADKKKEVLLLANGTETRLSWAYRLDGRLPHVYCNDYNNDGKKELAVIFTAEGKMDGEEFMELHILSPDTMQEYVWEPYKPEFEEYIIPMYIKLCRGDAAAYIFLSVSEEEKETYHYLFTAETEYVLDKTDFEDVSFGSGRQIFAEDGSLFVRYPVYVLKREYEVGFVTERLIWQEEEQRFIAGAAKFRAESAALLGREAELPLYFTSAVPAETVTIQISDYDPNLDGVCCVDLDGIEARTYPVMPEMLAFIEDGDGVQRMGKEEFLGYLESAGQEGVYRLYLHDGMVVMAEKAKGQ